MDDAAPIRAFDADNHYWEVSDAFTRYRDPKFADRGIQVVDADGAGDLRYQINGRQHPILPGPGDVQPRPRPGALYDYFAGRSDKQSLGAELACEDPALHPEWFSPASRLEVMDAQGLEACWLFPSHGVCVEGPMQPDVEASVAILRAFNRWLDDDWGFAHANRIFGAPFLTLSDVDAACAELEWCIDRGARVITIRNGPVFTPDGTRSPADPRFDPFWARVQEAELVVAPHAGFDDGYRDVMEAVASAWGYHDVADSRGPTNALTLLDPTVQSMMKNRLIQDFATVLVVHGLFERFPRLRVAYIESGGTWVAPLLHLLEIQYAQHRDMFASNPVDQFVEHCWVAPFVEDDVAELGTVLPVERILFGSDWPHAEGLGDPRSFESKLDGFSAEDRHKIMYANAAGLTYR